MSSESEPLAICSRARSIALWLSWLSGWLVDVDILTRLIHAEFWVGAAGQYVAQVLRRDRALDVGGREHVAEARGVARRVRRADVLADALERCLNDLIRP